MAMSIVKNIKAIKELISERRDAKSIAWSQNILEIGIIAKGRNAKIRKAFIVMD
jgi:hypothetical protein